ncbi:MAG: Uma2 family endonuclease [Isosphaeraceae bacterium]
MATASQPHPAEFPSERLHRVDVDTYQRMAEAGILTGRDRVVLLDGLLVNIMTRGDAHVASTKLTVIALQGVVPRGGHVSKEDPIALIGGPTGLDSVPEPEVLMIRGGVRDYAKRTPGPSDLASIVEVADRTLKEDRSGLVRYAWAGIPAAWIVNLPDGVVEVFTQPSGPDPRPGYRSTQAITPGRSVPVALDGQEVGAVAVDGLLP